MLLCSGDLGASGDASVDVGDARDNGPPAERRAEPHGSDCCRASRSPMHFFSERGRTFAPARTYSKLGRALRGCRPSDP